VLYYLCYSFHCQLVAIGEWWSGSIAKVYISKEDLEKAGTEHALLVMNHAYETDWLFGWFFCEKIGVLGNCKAYAKKVISYIPTIGWNWKFAEFVFLERSFDKDKEIIKSQLNEIFDYPDPVWLLINAEGTRFTKTKHAASVKFAQERGMAVLNHHLIPRTKGFTASLSVLKKKCAAIMDVQLAFDENDVNKPTIINLLRGKKCTGHLYLRRIPMSEVPEDEEAAAKWLQELYVRKDKLQTSFHETGDFFKNSGIAPIEPIVMPPRLSSLINWVAWMVIAMLPILYLLINMILSGQFFYVLIGCAIVIACKYFNFLV
jgi:lysophosphatidic acid acyltransferase / lysophosphatidylinositol acyltransferase